MGDAGATIEMEDDLEEHIYLGPQKANQDGGQQKAVAKSLAKYGTPYSSPRHTLTTRLHALTVATSTH